MNLTISDVTKAYLCGVVVACWMFARPVVAQDPLADPSKPNSIRERLKGGTPAKPSEPNASTPKPKPSPTPDRKPATPKSRVPEELKPRLEKVMTKDGVSLRIGYFPSDKGKKAAPVLLIHEWTGQMSPYTGLAQKLQDAGCAVALLDIRGHGRSQITGADGKPIEVERATKRDMEAVATLDLEAAKKFLKAENDAGNLNLNALTVIGIREGAILAMNWTVMDWSWPSIGSKKQGQDVKAMVLVSPLKSVNGVTGETALRHQTVKRLPVMIVSGSATTENSEASRLAKMFERARVAGKFNSTKPLPVDGMRVRAKLTGARLVVQGKGVVDNITKFVVENVYKKQDSFPWVARDE